MTFEEPVPATPLLLPELSPLKLVASDGSISGSIASGQQNRTVVASRAITLNDVICNRCIRFNACANAAEDSAIVAARVVPVNIVVGNIGRGGAGAHEKLDRYRYPTRFLLVRC